MAHLIKSGIRSLVSRRVTSFLPKQQPAGGAPKRSFSSTSAQHEDAEEAVKWRNITFVGFAVCGALTVYNFTGKEEEHEERIEYSYLHIRNKEFPWGPDGLFEYRHEH